MTAIEKAVINKCVRFENEKKGKVKITRGYDAEGRLIYQKEVEKKLFSRKEHVRFHL